MKRLMEEAAARHVEAIHNSASASIRVGEKMTKNLGSGRLFSRPYSEEGCRRKKRSTQKNVCAKLQGGATPLKKAPAL